MTELRLSSLYAEHVRERIRTTEEALRASNFDALVLYSGSLRTYSADDQDIPFRSFPHFAHFVPLEGPYHLLVVKPRQKPLLIRVKPEDYWYEVPELKNPFWTEQFEFREVADKKSAWHESGVEHSAGRTAFVGEFSTDEIRAHGIPEEAINPPSLISKLDWHRSVKTPYEIACLTEAEKLAAKGHHAARKAFFAGASELEIHHAYVQALQCTDKELPYESIVALNEKSAILHYQGKRTNVKNGAVLLIDSGARYLGYCSDISRTWTSDACDPLFQELVAGLEQVQQALCKEVTPGIAFPTLHHSAHLKIADLLHSLQIIHISGEDVVTAGLTKVFFPHGVGHFLGIQVHDVGGTRAEHTQTNAPEQRSLRMTRTIEKNQVFTVEPGIYFIEMLLHPHRKGAQSKNFNWELIQRLMPFGGARIEDNILVTQNSNQNLTRPYI